MRFRYGLTAPCGSDLTLIRYSVGYRGVTFVGEGGDLLGEAVRVDGGDDVGLGAPNGVCARRGIRTRVSRRKVLRRGVDDGGEDHAGGRMRSGGRR